MSRRPLIGVSSSELRAPADVTQVPEGEPPQRHLTLGLSYLRSIEIAGALGVVLSPLDHGSVEQLVDRLAGVCISGGPDLHPASYGAAPHHKLGPTEPQLDEFELTLAGAACARGLPVLGICRGAQVLNVALGGTLHQHLPDDPRTSVDHRQSEPGDVTTHRVEVTPGSLLADCLGQSHAAVNSFHHQASDEFGSDLVPVAWAADGVVEAIESPGREFVLGVQWHAECLLARVEQRALFASFVEAARNHDRRVEALVG